MTVRLFQRMHGNACFGHFRNWTGQQAMTDGGTGLGLSICHHLIGPDGRHIGCDGWVRRERPEGNVFWMVLPAVALPFTLTGSARQRTRSASPRPASTDRESERYNEPGVDPTTDAHPAD